MIKVAAITQGRTVPSARYRVRQNIPYLGRHNIFVQEYFPHISLSPTITGLPKNLRRFLNIAISPAKILSRLYAMQQCKKFDMVWLQREMIEGLLTFEKHLTGTSKVIFDVDDAIWLSNKYLSERAESFLDRISCIIAGNQFLANWFDRFNRNVHIIPTGVDTNRFVPAGQEKNDHVFRIGWIGTSSNLLYLEELEQPLKSFLRKYSDARLLIVSNAQPRFRDIPDRQIQYVKWSENIEVQVIQSMDVGIMPLPNDDWTRGKCSFKMLQYMACGIPVISSPVGMNKEVLAKGEVGFSAKTASDWLDSLEYIYKNRGVAHQMGISGRNVVVSHYSSQIISKKIADVFTSIM